MTTTIVDELMGLADAYADAVQRITREPDGIFTSRDSRTALHTRLRELLEGEAAESATRHQADVLRLRNNISTLVAGPMMHHHKMDASDIRAAEAFDRCRELTLANFATHFALSDAIRAAMQSEQGEQG